MKSAPTRRRMLVFAGALLGLGLPPMMAAAAARSVAHTVVIEGMQFIPAALEIHAGDTVIWKNKDPFPHTATSDSKAGFDSREIKPNRSWKYIATKRGAFPYVCTLHPTMKGSLVVK